MSDWPPSEEWKPATDEELQQTESSDDHSANKTDSDPTDSEKPANNTEQTTSETSENQEETDTDNFCYLTFMPVEVLLQIFTQLQLDDILSASVTCSYLNYVAHDEPLWRFCCKVDYGLETLPIPLEDAPFPWHELAKLVYPYRKYLGYWRLYGIPVLLRVQFCYIRCRVVITLITSIHTRRTGTELSRLKRVVLTFKNYSTIKQLWLPSGPKRLLGYVLLRICMIRKVSDSTYLTRYSLPTGIPSYLKNSEDYLPMAGIYVDTPSQNDSEMFSISYGRDRSIADGNLFMARYVTGNLFARADQLGFYGLLDSSYSISLTEQLDWELLKRVSVLDSEPHPHEFAIPPDCLFESDTAGTSWSSQQDLPEYCLGRYKAVDKQYLDQYKTSYTVHLIVFSREEFALFYIYRKYLVCFKRIADEELSDMAGCPSMPLDN